MMKFLNIGRIVAFSITVLSTIPLFISYLRGVPPRHPLIVHLHVWFGLVFLILAIVGMVTQKKNRQGN